MSKRTAYQLKCQAEALAKRMQELIDSTEANIDKIGPEVQADLTWSDIYLRRAVRALSETDR